MVTNCPPAQGFFQLGITNAIRPGFTNYSLPPEDDDPSSLATLPLSINFYGTWYSNVWVNNNGNVTFDRSLGPTIFPTPLIEVGASGSSLLTGPMWIRAISPPMLCNMEPIR